MAEDTKFRMTHDQSGEIVHATMADEAEYRAKGFRILDAGLYQTAYGAVQDSRRVVVPLTPEQEAAAAQNYEDARRVANGAMDDPDANFQRQPENPEDAPRSNVGTEAYIRETYAKGTVDKLRQYAKSEGVDLTGVSRKEDILDALVAHDRAAGRILDTPATPPPPGNPEANGDTPPTPATPEGNGAPDSGENQN